jgi:hypothetical protein
MFRWVVSVGAALALVLSPGAGAAAGPQPQAEQPLAVVTARPAGKLSFRLQALADSSALQTASAEDRAQALSLAPDGPGSLLTDAAGRLLVYIRLAGLSPDALQAIRLSGADIVNVAEPYGVVTALVRPADLARLAAVDAVAYVQEEVQPMTGSWAAREAAREARAEQAPAIGAQTTEGDTQLRAALARTTFGVNGAGVTVGVLSDSHNQAVGAPTTAAQDVASGDLPGPGNPNGFTTPVNVISPSLSGGNSDEGRAMAQIVHDLAPGATLAFASAFNGLYAFAANIRNLKNAAGAGIIVDDVSYFTEPFFQEGPVSVAISDVTKTGAMYFTSAGNSNEIVGGNNVASYEAPAFRPTSCPAAITTGTCHDFDTTGGVDNGADYTFGALGSITLILQWAEPWNGVTTDLDVFLLNAGGTVVASSQLDNISNQVPAEYFSFTAPVGGGTYRVVINRFAGAGTPRVKYLFIRSSNLTAAQYNTSAGGDIVGPTVYGHSADRYALSVAAVPYNSNTTPEEFSSRGPATLYFGPVVGNSAAPAIAPVVLNRPDFGATDGGCNTFFGGLSAGCRRFYGTSAAAPHAAAVAALMKQRANQAAQALGQTQVETLLESTARSMSGGTPTSVGAGLIDALAAVSATAQSTVTISPRVRVPILLKNSGGPTPPPSWTTIASEDFESASALSGWNVFDNTGATGGEYFWARRTCNPHAGSYSGWGVGGGANGSGLACGANYPNDADSWMVYGPFSLAGATAAELNFWMSLTTETNFDFLNRLASIDGSNFYGSRTSGNTGGWVTRTLNLANVFTLGNLLGQSQVWIAVSFSSDDSNTLPNGAFVDDIVLRKCETASCPGLAAAGPAPAAPETAADQSVDAPIYMRLQR